MATAPNCEWEFDVPPDQVDLIRLWNEFRALPCIHGYVYLEKLYQKAPKTYTRLRQWRREQHCVLVDWSYDPEKRF